MRRAALHPGQLWQACAQIARQTLLGSGPPRKLDHFRWLYAPDLLSFGYALRTTISSPIGLGLAMWWELGSLQGEALKGWRVGESKRVKTIDIARGSRGGMEVGDTCPVELAR